MLKEIDLIMLVYSNFSMIKTRMKMLSSSKWIFVVKRLLKLGNLAQEVPHVAI